MSARAGWVGVSLLSLNALFVTGCFTLAKQAYAEARGAQGEVLPIEERRAPGLARCQGLEFTAATTTVGPRICPREMLGAYDRAVNQLAARLKPLFPGGSPELKVNSEILYLQKKGMLGSALLLVRTKMYSDDQLAADALVRVESEAFRAGGEDDLARAAAEALRKFLERQKSRGERDTR
jgi:hypothetical protein